MKSHDSHLRVGVFSVANASSKMRYLGPCMWLPLLVHVWTNEKGGGLTGVTLLSYSYGRNVYRTASETHLSSLILPVNLFWLLPVCLFPMGLSLRAGKMAGMQALSIRQNRNIDKWGISGGKYALFVVLDGVWRIGGSESGHVTRWTNHMAEIWILSKILEKSHYY